MDLIRILLVEDHHVLRAGMRLLLERHSGFKVVGEAADGRELLGRVQDQQPNVVVMDIAMPKLNGLEATRRIVEKHPGIGVVMLSMHDDESYIIRAMMAGARAYLSKDALGTELIAAIQAAAQSKSYFSPKISKILQENYIQALRRGGFDDSFNLLTDREHEILQLIAEGKTNKEVADLLNLSTYTVDTHRARVLQKLNLHSVPELILYAVRKGIIS